MSILSKLGDFLTGGIGDKIYTAIKDYFPPNMSESEKALLQLKIKEVDHQHQMEGLRMQLEAEQAVTERVAQLEGTVSELKTIPFVGAFVIFTRAMQRQVWGYSTLYINFLWFSGQWKFTEQQESAMWVINLLVLGFLFGERAIQNIAPLIGDLMSKRIAK